MKKTIISILSLILLSAALPAQHTRGEIKLKNGEVVKGTILQQSIGKGATIEDHSGNVTYYSEEEIVSISQEPGRAGQSKNGIYVREKGIYSRVAFGMGFTENRARWNPEQRVLNVSTAFEGILGNRFSSRVNIGFGTGIRWYPDGTSIVPFFLDFRGDLDLKNANKAIVPHYVLNAGYGALASERWDVAVSRQTGGLLTYAGLGFKMRTRGYVEWTYTVGFRRQSTFEEYTPFRDQNTLVRGTRHMQELSFDLGISF